MANLCFWNGLLSKIDKDDFSFLFNKYRDLQNESEELQNMNKSKLNIENFINLLKNINQKIRIKEEQNNSKQANNYNDIKWQNISLSKIQLNENFDHIKNFDVSKITDGYWCSTCDPFLILICKIFEIDIEHNYCNIKINYNNTSNSRKKLIFNSNRNHFW